MPISLILINVESKILPGPVLINLKCEKKIIFKHYLYFYFCLISFVQSETLWIFPATNFRVASLTQNARGLYCMLIYFSLCVILHSLS